MESPFDRNSLNSSELVFLQESDRPWVPCLAGAPEPKRCPVAIATHAKPVQVAEREIDHGISIACQRTESIVLRREPWTLRSSESSVEQEAQLCCDTVQAPLDRPFVIASGNGIVWFGAQPVSERVSDIFSGVGIAEVCGAAEPLQCKSVALPNALAVSEPVSQIEIPNVRAKNIVSLFAKMSAKTVI